MKKSQISKKLSSPFRVNLQGESYCLVPNLGQVVLILVLLTVVGLTVGLSLISRTVTDIRISSQIEQSGRAFSAAEAGVETALKSAVIDGPTGSINFSGTQTNANYQVTKLGGTTSVYFFETTKIGAIQTLWLIGHNENGTLNESSDTYSLNKELDICWGSEADNNAAIILTLLYKEGADYKIAKVAYDPVPTASGHNDNHFISANIDILGGYCDGNFRFKKTINGAAEFWDGFTPNPGILLMALRFQPVYQDTKIAVKPTANLPSQGKQIISVGQTETGIVRKIRVNQSYQTLPEIFNFTLFSGS